MVKILKNNIPNGTKRSKKITTMKKFLFLLFVLISFSIESQERFNNQMLNGEWEIIYDENNEEKRINIILMMALIMD